MRASPSGTSKAVTGASVLFWLVAHALQRVPVVYALTYPVGALAAAILFVRSALRGANVAWKGREYRMSGGTGGVENRPHA